MLTRSGWSPVPTGSVRPWAGRKRRGRMCLHRGLGIRRARRAAGGRGC